jgi:hypothetical protein
MKNNSPMHEINSRSEFVSQYNWIRQQASVSMKPQLHTDLQKFWDATIERYPEPSSLAHKINTSFVQLVDSLLFTNIDNPEIEFWCAENEYEVWMLTEYLCVGAYRFEADFVLCQSVMYNLAQLKKIYKSQIMSGSLGHSRISEYLPFHLAKNANGMWLEITPIDNNLNKVQIILKFNRLYCSIDKK